MKEEKNSVAEPVSSPPPAPDRGFATTPHVLRFGGPQMEDYPDWDAWLFARRVWVMERMGGKPSQRMKAWAESRRIKEK